MFKTRLPVSTVAFWTCCLTHSTMKSDSPSAEWLRVCAPSLSSPWPNQSPADPAERRCIQDTKTKKKKHAESVCQDSQHGTSNANCTVKSDSAVRVWHIRAQWHVGSVLYNQHWLVTAIINQLWQNTKRKKKNWMKLQWSLFIFWEKTEEKWIWWMLSSRYKTCTRTKNKTKKKSQNINKTYNAETSEQEFKRAMQLQDVGSSKIRSHTAAPLTSAASFFM